MAAALFWVPVFVGDLASATLLSDSTELLDTTRWLRSKSTDFLAESWEV